MGYPVEFRRKVFKLKAKKGLTYEEVSELFGVSMRTLFRWNTRIEIKKKAPKPRVINLEELKNDVKNHPDSYQWERAQLLASHAEQAVSLASALIDTEAADTNMKSIIKAYHATASKQAGLFYGKRDNGGQKKESSDMSHRM